MAGDADAVTPFAGWVPAGADHRNENAPVLWFRLGEIRFDDAYFSDTMARCARHPFNLAFARRTSWQMVEDAASRLPQPALSGMVFHLSRCGSTLVSRLLAAVTGTLVISESPALDAAIRGARREGASEDAIVRRLRALAAIYAAASGSHRHYVVKLDAWHACDLALFERAFPGVPWVYVYRDPVEVLVSHLNRSSYLMSAANAPDFIGVPITEAVRMPRVTYCARVLGRIAAAAADREPEADALVRYDDLPGAVWERIAPRFGMQLSGLELEAMRRRAAYDAKQPQTVFQDDRAAKQRAADAAILAASQAFLDPEMARLDQLRARGR